MHSATLLRKKVSAPLVASVRRLSTVKTGLTCTSSNDQATTSTAKRSPEHSTSAYVMHRTRSRLQPNIDAVRRIVHPLYMLRREASAWSSYKTNASRSSHTEWQSMQTCIQSHLLRGVRRRLQVLTRALCCIVQALHVFRDEGVPCARSARRLGAGRAVLLCWRRLDVVERYQVLYLLQ